ncbi:hypothetical protein IV203_003642 [Nitzschia inconspicua]|uniref:Uncharacterized protein n=1 Tax=Nitzschia inconspicua TaxID=303405 RepID=A0A9K3L3V7_9STRA|nr:hypothetical protein IV203_003642 [Nitzschia inconspicua]
MRRFSGLIGWRAAVFIICLGCLRVSIAETAQAPTIASSAAGSSDETLTQKITSYVETCKATGFDPWHLACSTCKILPSSVQTTCQHCCQNYKTLDSQATRYSGAIVVDTGSSSALNDFFREDGDIVQNQKKGVKRKNLDMGGGARMFQQLFMQPSLVLWYDRDPPSESASLEKLSADAVEITTLDGLSRDDIREMLLALLPDK